MMSKISWLKVLINTNGNLAYFQLKTPNIATLLKTSFYHYRFSNPRFFTMPSNETKLLKIGTHDGVFHCDEVLACYMLKLLPEYKDANIVRTRDEERLKDCDIVVDVGGVFNHSSKRYDHHQREFKETFSSLRPEHGENWNIKLSSAGLIYIYYGEDCIRQVLKSENITINDDQLVLIYKKVYENLIQEVDGIDNGVPISTEELRYKINTNLSARVARLNPEWNSVRDLNVQCLFEKAMTLVREEFLDVVKYYAGVWLPCRDIVKRSLENRFNVHSSGQIIEFSESIPWKGHFHDLEEELGISNIVKFVIFNDKPDSWRVQAVPVTNGSFICRKFLHKNWRGIRDQCLADIAGIPDSIFCHTTGFIGGNKTRDGALKMAIASLEYDENS